MGNSLAHSITTCRVAICGSNLRIGLERSRKLLTSSNAILTHIPFYMYRTSQLSLHDAALRGVRLVWEAKRD
jgi:hypothetical protein